MGFRAIGVAKSLPCAVRIKLLTTLFADTLRVLMTVIRRPAFHLGFSSVGCLYFLMSLINRPI